MIRVHDYWEVTKLCCNIYKNVLFILKNTEEFNAFINTMNIKFTWNILYE